MDKLQTFLLAFLVNSHHCWNDIITQLIGGFNCHKSDLKIDIAIVLGHVFLHVPPPLPGHLYPYTLFDQFRIDIIDQAEYGVHDRLHIYPTCVESFTSARIDTR